MAFVLRQAVGRSCFLELGFSVDLVDVLERAAKDKFHQPNCTEKLDRFEIADKYS